MFEKFRTDLDKELLKELFKNPNLLKNIKAFESAVRDLLKNMMDTK